MVAENVAEIQLDEEVFLPKFRPLRDDTGIDIDLMYGGRDSGKSLFEAQRLVLKCLSEDYFRYILIRKGANTIKDSQWQTIKDVVEEWNLESLFVFNISPLEIRCINGNKFICRGLDEPAKLKSISNPSGAWLEEGNQASEEDFIFLLSTLRSNEGNIKLDFTFNPEADTPDFTEFWIYKRFFSHTVEKSFTKTTSFEVGDEQFHLTYRAHHSTYHDNPFVTVQRKAIHESLKVSNYYWYNVFTLGEWGNRLNESPWLFAFSRDKHVRKGIYSTISRDLPLWTCWDFNRNPMCAGIVQHDKDKKELRVLKAYKVPNTGVDEICDMIKVDFPGYLLLVAGDYSGHNEQSVLKEHITHYNVIKSKLNLSDGQIKVQKNPRLEKNRTLVNLVFQHYTVLIDEDHAKPLIFDCENVQALADGTILKEDRKDPKQQADSIDWLRYLINVEFKDFEKMYLL